MVVAPHLANPLSPQKPMKFASRTQLQTLLFFVLALGVLAVSGNGLGQEPGATAANPKKILFLGNSITLHGPKKDIGWAGHWGMAASAEDKDFVHLVAKALTGKDGRSPEILVKNIASFEREFAKYDPAVELKDATTFNADLIVVAIGENVPALGTEEAKAGFSDRLVRLLKSVTADRKPRIIVRSCFWANAAKDESLKRACREIGGRFLDISALGKEEANYARSERKIEHKGVANHPGDRGMRAIADAIVGAVRLP